jgi:hypothetical protein
MECTKVRVYDTITFKVGCASSIDNVIINVRFADGTIVERLKLELEEAFIPAGSFSFYDNSLLLKMKEQWKRFE